MVDVLTVRGAARRLASTEAEVIHLIESGKLIGEQLPDGGWLVEVDSLRRYRNQTLLLGRPWSPQTAWAALAELDQISIHRLYANTTALLHDRLRTITPRTLARKVAGRVTIGRFSGELEHIKPALLLTGPSAIPAAEHTTEQEVHAYVAGPYVAAPQFAADHQLVSRIEGTLHLYDRPIWVNADEIGPAAIAADLANSANELSRQNGMQMLANMQDRWIESHPTPSRRRQR